MDTFFHGWRRKAGVVSLVMSLVLVGGWIRSRTGTDRIAIRKYGAATEYLVSQESGLGWSREIYFSMISVNVLTDVPYREWYGFKYGQKLVSPPVPVCKVSVRIIPYWSLTIPLTLLSAYLILRKPR